MMVRRALQAVLETTLRGYSCLTVGDTMCVHYNNKKYFIDVVEAKPAEAICVIDTDCEVNLNSTSLRPKGKNTTSGSAPPLCDVLIRPLISQCRDDA